MSVIKITVSEEHLKLVKYLTFSTIDGHLTTSEEDKESAFGYEDLHTEIGLILYGKPENFDPMSTDPISYTDEQKAHMDELWSDMPTILELKCYFDNLLPGLYKRKFHNRDWRKIS